MKPLKICQGKNGMGGMSGGKIVGMGGQGQMGPMMQQGVPQQGVPGGPNQMNAMGGMGGMQVNPGGQMNQNALNQQLNPGGMNSGAGQMVGNNPMNPGQMGMGPNQMIRQQMPPGMNPNQQMAMAGGQMNQMNQSVGGLGGNLGQVPQVPWQQQVQGGMPPNLQQQPGPGGPNVGGGQMNAGGMGPGGAMPGNQMAGQGNFVPGMVLKPQDMMSGGQVFPGGAVRSVTPNQFLRQSPSSSVPSPVGPGSLGPQSHPGQMIPSPALIPSPSPQMGSVPPRNIGQSPGSNFNTPGQLIRHDQSSR